MKKVLIAGLIGFFMLLATGIGFAAVGLQEEGTKVGTVEKVNIVGDGVTATVSGNTGTLTFTGASATPTVTGGTINGATIGATSPSSGVFTTLRATTSTNWTDNTVIAQGATINWQDVTLVGIGINWTDTTLVGNPTSISGAGAAINWTDATANLTGATFNGINWTDAHYLCVSDAGVVSAGSTCP